MHILKNKKMSDKNRVFIFDTTMRDGEQSPGASMSLEEKIQIARVFDELGVDIIEAGFPIASPGDFVVNHFLIDMHFQNAIQMMTMHLQ